MLRCPNCLMPNDGYTSANGGDSAPEAGDIQVCAYCGAILRYVEGRRGGVLGLKRLSYEEVSKLGPDVWREIARVEGAIRAMWAERSK